MMLMIYMQMYKFAAFFKYNKAHYHIFNAKIQ